MSRVLYYQHEVLSEESCVVIDGRLVEGLERSAKFDQLIELMGKVAKYEEPWVGALLGHHFVKGLLDNHDELGRPMVFIYILPIAEDRSLLLSLLIQDLEKQGKGLERKTIDAIKSYQSGLSAKMRLFGGVIVLVVLLVCLLIWLKR